MIYGRVFLNPPDVGQLTPRLRYKIRWPDTDGSGRAIFRCSFSVEGGGRGGGGRSIYGEEEFATEGGGPIPRLKIFSARLGRRGIFQASMESRPSGQRFSIF